MGKSKREIPVRSSGWGGILNDCVICTIMDLVERPGKHFCLGSPGIWIDESSESPTRGIINFISHGTPCSVHGYLVGRKRVKRKSKANKR